MRRKRTVLIFVILGAPLLPGSHPQRAAGYPAAPLSGAPYPPAALLPIPEGVQTLLLLGADEAAAPAERTDALLLALIHPGRGRVSLVSIPRDLYVYLPGRGMERINRAYALGGAGLLAEVLEYHLGLRPDHWALVHFEAFTRLVDDLGGVDLAEAEPLPEDCGGVAGGAVHLDGPTALCYVRSRFSTSDFARSRRQQEVLRAILARFVRLDNLARLPEWYRRYRPAVQTDLDLAGLLAAAPAILKLAGSGQAAHYQIGWDQVDGYQVLATGADVLIPRPQAVRDLLLAALGSLEQQTSMH